MKNNTRDINNIDDDISTETRSIEEKKLIIKPKAKWTGSDVILPVVINNTISVKKIEDTSIEEFASWLRQVMPFTSKEIETYIQRGVNNNKEKIGLFETAVILHVRRWLFGLGEPEQPDESTRWS